MNIALKMPPVTPGPTTEAIPKSASLPPAQQYHNPIPVVIGLVPVVSVHDGQERVGLLTVRRGIEPAIGKLALPGGYLEYEDWKTGCTREILEETGLAISESDILDTASLSSVQNGTRLLIFAQTKPVDAAQLERFTPNSETEELVVIYEPTDLAFPTHTAQARRFFESLRTTAN